MSIGVYNQCISGCKKKEKKMNHTVLSLKFSLCIYFGEKIPITNEGNIASLMCFMSN